MNVIRKTISLLLAGILLFAMFPSVLAEESGAANGQFDIWTEDGNIQDKMSGATYTLPSAWTVDSVIDNKEEFRITCSLNKDGFFVCSTRDVWAALDNQAKDSYDNDRSNVNNTIFTPELIALMYGWDPDKVFQGTFGRNTFFVYDRTETLNGLDYHWSTFVIYWNGYSTNISLVVPPYAAESITDLLALLETFVYPGEKPADAASWTCTFCGTENNGNFCSECGAPKPEDRHWICPNCQTENEGNFCSECGTKKS